MCKYCKKEEAIVDTPTFVVEINGITLEIECFDYYNTAIEIIINYCPMCGKKL